MTVAWDGNDKFSHFVNSSGEVAVVDQETKFARVCVMTNCVSEVTDEQRAAVHTLSVLATEQNKGMWLRAAAKDLSPFCDKFLERVEKVIEHMTTHEPLGAPALRG